MPELPEVETVCRGLNKALKNKVLRKVILNCQSLRHPFPKDFCVRLEHQTIIAIGRRAKYILVSFSDHTVLIWHLGMSGRVNIFWPNDHQIQPQEQLHDHVTFETTDNIVVRFNDPRRFGSMDLAHLSSLSNHPKIRNLGPEPLDVSFDTQMMAECLRGRSKAIKLSLLDQKVISGIGNIYASECLYRAGISPRRTSSSVRGKRLERLVAAIKIVLSDAIASGGSSLRDHRQTNGELGYFQHKFLVYGKAGQDCQNKCCVAKIQHIVQSGRSTFFCSACQR